MLGSGRNVNVLVQFRCSARYVSHGPTDLGASVSVRLRLGPDCGVGASVLGPAAPASGPAHHYVFELYALDVWIDVPAVGQSPATTRTAVMAAMSGHVRGKGVLTARYRRPAP